MENFDPIDVDFLINSDQVKKDAKIVKDELRGIGDEAENIEQKVKKQLDNSFKGSNVEIDKATAAIGRQKRQFDGLGFSIAQITRELPAFTYSAQTGFLAISNNIPMLADEIGKLKKENDALIASGQKGQSVIGQLAKSFLSWQTVLSVGVTLLTVYVPQIISFLGNLFKTKRAIDDNKKSMEALNRAYESSSYQKAIKSIIEVRAAFAGAGTDIDKKAKALKLYNETLGNSLGTAKNYNEAEKTFIEKSGAYVKALLYRAAAAEAVNEASKELIRLAKEEDEIIQKIEEKRAATPYQSQTFDRITEGLYEDLEDVRKKMEDVGTGYGRIINSQNNAANKLASAFGLNLEGDDKASSQTISKRETLVRRLLEIDKEYALKKLDNDEAEVQALRDKFSKMRREVEDFNKNKKNTEAAISLKGFDELEESAVSDLKYKQETQLLKEELEKQKQIFEEFEEYKRQFGVAKAKEQYAEQLKGFNSFAEVLREQWELNKDAFSAVASGDATAVELERTKLIEKETEIYTKAQEKQYTALLASLQTYEEKRSALTKKYNEDRLKLLADGEFKKAEVLKKIHDETMDELDLANAKATEEYKKLTNGIEGLSNKAAEAVVKATQKMVERLQSAGVLSKTAAQDIINEINKVNGELAIKKQIDINEIANVFGNIGWALTQAGDEITKAVGNMVQEIGGTISALAELSGQEGKGLQRASSLVGLIVQAGNLLKSIGDETQFADVTAQKDLNKELVVQMQLEDQINQLRRERAEIERNSSAFLDSYYKEDFTAALQQRVDSEQKLVDSMRTLSENGIFSTEGVGKRLLFGKKRENRDFTMEQILGDYNPRGYYEKGGLLLGPQLSDPLSIFGGYSDQKVSQDALKKMRSYFEDTLTAMGKTSADMANFSAEEWLDFFTLMDEAGNITDKATKAMLANAQTALAEYQAAMEEMKKIISDFGGQLGNQLADNLVQAFREGESAAEGFKKSLNNILTELFLQDLINTQFRSYFDNLQKEMQDSMGLDGDQSWIDDIVRFGDSINPALDQGLAAIGAFNDQLKALGYEGFDSADTANKPGLQGAIRRELTEETGSELTGLFRGQFDITKRQLQLSEKHFELEQRHFDATMRMVQLSALIEQNTAGTVMELKAAVLELRTISKNTKPSQTGRDLGLG